MCGVEGYQGEDSYCKKNILPIRNTIRNNMNKPLPFKECNTRVRVDICSYDNQNREQRKDKKTVCCKGYPDEEKRAGQDLLRLFISEDNRDCPDAGACIAITIPDIGYQRCHETPHEKEHECHQGSRARLRVPEEDREQGKEDPPRQADNDIFNCRDLLEPLVTEPGRQQPETVQGTQDEGRAGGKEGCYPRERGEDECEREGDQSAVIQVRFVSLGERETGLEIDRILILIGLPVEIVYGKRGKEGDDGKNRVPWQLLEGAGNIRHCNTF